MHGDKLVAGEISEWSDSEAVGLGCVGVVGPHEFEIGIEYSTAHFDRGCINTGAARGIKQPLRVMLGHKCFPQEGVIVMQF